MLGQGTDFLLLSESGAPERQVVLSDNGCMPSRLEWTGEWFIAAYSRTIYADDPVRRNPRCLRVRIRIRKWTSTSHAIEVFFTLDDGTRALFSPIQISLQ